MLILRFWFFEAPIGILRFFRALNLYTVNLFSLKLLFRTFFKPMKNEYRKGLIGFSIMMGVMFKSFLILISFFMLFLMMFFEILFLFLFIVFPFIPLYLFFT
jgi:hypothetical protein